MKKSNLLTEIIKNGCVIFTVITIAAYTVGYALSSESNQFIPTLSWIYMFLLFSLPLAAANIILRDTRRSFTLRILFHFLTTAALYFVVVVMCGDFISSGAQTLIAMALFLIIYGIFALIYGITHSIRSKKQNKKESYSSMFN